VEKPQFNVKLMEVATDVVRDNVEKFTPELTQAETDRLLKQLLYDKLFLSDKTPKTKTKPKEKKKKKFKVVQPQSSSESESDSD
jgi:hypothetical protein